jgi:hypothetical protein
MKKSERNWMAGIGVLVIMLSAFAFTACDLLGGNEDDKDDKSKPPADNGIDYTNYMSGYSVKVKNDANKNLVAFKGAPSASTLISGVPIGGGEHGLKKDAALFATSGDFVLFLVSEEDYLANKNSLSALANRPFTRIYAYYNADAENKLTYTISSILGGSKKIVLQNSTSYNVELRRDNAVDGAVIGYAGQGTYNTTFNVEPGNYTVFPVFRKFNSGRGEIITVYPRYQGGAGDGRAKFTEFSLDDSLNQATINAADYVAGVTLKIGSAYLVIQNNHITGMGLWDGTQRVTTSTGGQLINVNRSLTFQIDMLNKPGTNDEYFDDRTMAQFKIGSSGYQVTLPEFTFVSDKIYSVTVSGNDPGDVHLSEITEIGTMTF